ncbi:flagellar hook-associated protein FlgL [Peptococcaceae bacterium]|nr:flagellar hook-associated protein FlgL [Peptococcaceae bacterium]
MRITNTYITNRVINSIQTNMKELARVQEQLSTSKRLLRLSDDPQVLGQLLSVRATLSYNEQYAKNIDDGIAYLEMTDASMGSLCDLLHQATEYAIQAANDTYNAEDRKAIAEQIDKMIDKVVDLANTTVGRRYIYAGMKNNHPPFKRDGDVITYHGDLNPVIREVAAQTDYRVDAPGITEKRIYNPPTDPDPGPGVFGRGKSDGNTPPTYTVYKDGEHEYGGIFQVLFDLRDRLNNNDAAGIQQSISELQNELDALLKHRAAVGARFRHFESLKTHLLDQEVKLTAALNKIEGADIAKLSIEYSQQQLTYNAALASGALIMQTSLLHFLR